MKKIAPALLTQTLGTTMSAEYKIWRSKNQKSKNVTDYSRKYIKLTFDLLSSGNIRANHSWFLTVLGFEWLLFWSSEGNSCHCFKTSTSLLGEPRWCDILLYVIQMSGQRMRLAVRLLLLYCRRSSRCSSVPSLRLFALFPVSFYKTSSKDKAGSLRGPAGLYSMLMLKHESMYTVVDWPSNIKTFKFIHMLQEKGHLCFI